MWVCVVRAFFYAPGNEIAYSLIERKKTVPDQNILKNNKATIGLHVKRVKKKTDFQFLLFWSRLVLLLIRMYNIMWLCVSESAPSRKAVAMCTHAHTHTIVSCNKLFVSCLHYTLSSRCLCHTTSLKHIFFALLSFALNVARFNPENLLRVCI